MRLNLSYDAAWEVMMKVSPSLIWLVLVGVAVVTGLLYIVTQPDPAATARYEETRRRGEKAHADNIKFQADMIALCREKGGVPIVSAIAAQLRRCDFPFAPTLEVR